MVTHFHQAEQTHRANAENKVFLPWPPGRKFETQRMCLAVRHPNHALDCDISNCNRQLQSVTTHFFLPSCQMKIVFFGDTNSFHLTQYRVRFRVALLISKTKKTPKSGVEKRFCAQRYVLFLNSFKHNHHNNQIDNHNCRHCQYVMFVNSFKHNHHNNYINKNCRDCLFKLMLLQKTIVNRRTYAAETSGVFNFDSSAPDCTGNVQRLPTFAHVQSITVSSLLFHTRGCSIQN